MFRQLLLVSCLIAASIACEELDVTFVTGPFSTAMEVTACQEQNTISAYVPGSDNFEEVSIFQDYDTGFGSAVVPSQSACYIYKLNYATYSEQVDFLREHNTMTAGTEGATSVISVAVDDAEEEFGSRIADFCGENPVFKVGTTEEEDEETALESEYERQTITFRKCCFFFFVIRCTNVFTITLSTGSSLVFNWLIG